MAIFPRSNDIRPLVAGFRAGFMKNEHHSAAEAGDTQIFDVWGGRRKYFEEYRMNLSASDAGTMIAFETDEDEFTYYSFDPTLVFNDEEIGTGDGSNLIFTIPAIETTGWVVEVADGVGSWTTKTLATHYNVTSGSGALGEDRVVFTGGNAPANDRAVRITYKGCHRYSCEFKMFEYEMANTMGRKFFSIRIEEAF